LSVLVVKIHMERNWKKFREINWKKSSKIRLANKRIHSENNIWSLSKNQSKFNKLIKIYVYL